MHSARVPPTLTSKLNHRFGFDVRVGGQDCAIVLEAAGGVCAGTGYCVDGLWRCAAIHEEV